MQWLINGDLREYSEIVEGLIDSDFELQSSPTDYIGMLEGLLDNIEKIISNEDESGYNRPLRRELKETFKPVQEAFYQYWYSTLKDFVPAYGSPFDNSEMFEVWVTNEISDDLFVEGYEFSLSGKTTKSYQKRGFPFAIKFDYTERSVSLIVYTDIPSDSINAVEFGNYISDVIGHDFTVALAMHKLSATCELDVGGDPRSSDYVKRLDYLAEKVAGEVVDIAKDYIA